MSEEMKKDMAVKLSDDELDAVAGGKITFRPLFAYMKAHGITLRKMMNDGVLLPAHVTRLSYDHNFTLKFVNHLCSYLHCQPWDIIAHIPDSEIDNSLEEMMAGLQD